MATVKKAAERDFRPGDVVPEAGIYLAEHAHEYRTGEELMLLPNTQFPRCQVCGDRVRFTLLRAVPYLFDDADFQPGR